MSESAERKSVFGFIKSAFLEEVPAGGSTAAGAVAARNTPVPAELARNTPLPAAPSMAVPQADPAVVAKLES